MSPVGIPAGVCPFAQAWLARLENEPSSDVAIFVTVCDQMRRAAEVAEETGRAVFLMHVPATWQTASAQRFYREELERLGRFLTRHGGHSPSRDTLISVLEQYDTARATLRGLGGVLPARQFSERIAEFLESVSRRWMIGPIASRPPLRNPLVLDSVLWVFLNAGRPVLFGLFERAGGEVVFDGTESGEAGLPPPSTAGGCWKTRSAKWSRRTSGGFPMWRGVPTVNSTCGCANGSRRTACAPGGAAPVVV
jgi:hypothetical protein